MTTTVACFGFNYYHQANSQQDNFVVSPTNVCVSDSTRSSQEASPVVLLSTGYHHTVGLTNDGSVYAWGTDYQVVRPAPTIVRFPRQSVRVAFVACGYKHSVALSVEGQTYSWGCGYFGRLGHGDEHSCAEPRLVESLKRVKMATVACGGGHTLGLSVEHVAYGWGFNRYQQCISSRDVNIFHPRQIPLSSLQGETPVQVICGRHHSGILSRNGLLFTWGLSSYGRLGHGVKGGRGQLVSYPKLVQARGLDHLFVQVSMGEAHSVAITNFGVVYTWGCGLQGRLGHGNDQHYAAPAVVARLKHQRAVHVSAGSAHTAVVTSDGKCIMWGVGHGGGGSSPSVGFDSEDVWYDPRRVSTRGEPVVHASCGGAHTAMLTLGCSMAEMEETDGQQVPVDALCAMIRHSSLNTDVYRSNSPFMIPLDVDVDHMEHVASHDTWEDTVVEGKRGPAPDPGPPNPTSMEQVFSWCRHGHVEQVKRLLLVGKLHPTARNSENGNTLLHVACQNNQLRMCKMLLVHGADIDVQNLKGQTCLHYCSKYNFLELFDYLVAQGANDTLVNDRGETCFEV